MSSPCCASPWQSGNQWDEPHEAKILGQKPIIFAANAQELLIAMILTDGRNQNPIRREPVDKRRRDARRGGGDDDAVVGRLLGPALRPVAKTADDVAQAQFAEPAFG